MTKSKMHGGAPTMLPIVSAIIAPVFKPSGSSAAAYELVNSLKLTGTESIERLMTAEGDVRTFTVSFWVKTDEPTPPLAIKTIFSASFNASGSFEERFSYIPSLEEFWFRGRVSAIDKVQYKYTGNINDASGWTHFTLRKDTDALSLILEINGVVAGFFEEDAFVDYDGYIGGNGNLHSLGSDVFNFNFRGWIADFHYIDGETYDSSYFIDGGGAPKAFTESHGVNGSHFLFEDALNLGKNEVGSDWTEVNSPSQSTDVPS